MRFLVLAPLLACAACTDVVEVLTPPPVAGNAPGDAGSDAAPPRDAGISGVTVDGGQEHTCATRDGALYCFGSGSRGKLALGVLSPAKESPAFEQRAGVVVLGDHVLGGSW